MFKTPFNRQDAKSAKETHERTKINPYKTTQISPSALWTHVPTYPEPDIVFRFLGGLGVLAVQS
jgi:hypothetical protein